MTRRNLFSILMLVLLAGVANAAKLQAMDIKQQGEKVSIYFSTQGKAKTKIFSLSSPHRLVVDFDYTKLGLNLSKLSLPNRLIQKVRSGKPNKHTLRIVFELKQKVSYQESQWQPQNHRLTGHRLLLSSTQIKSKEKKSLYRSPSRKLRDVVVVIDAGHGGKDPGAMGSRGSKEKNVVLAIARKLKYLIDKQPGMRAVMTRKGDYYVGLRKRLKIARDYDGDIFVAIHADAFKNRRSNGASVYAVSQMGATSEAARWLAEKENYSELGGVDLSDLDDANGVVRSVLIDLSQTATIGASLEMGKQVLGHLDKITRLHHNDVEQARFVVLKSPDIPSILVETGFISNPREEKNLNNSAYQRRLARAIFSGVRQYFWDFPPHGTYIEAMTEAKIHVVKAGDTLSGIASRYNVSMKSLCNTNHISTKSWLKIGQKIVIPKSWS